MIVVIVTVIDGNPKPPCAVGGEGMLITASSSAVSATPNPTAASQWVTAIQRRRQASQIIASPAAGTSTAASPIEASPAISRSASGLRSVVISPYTFWSIASASPRISTVVSNANQAQPMPISRTARIASEGDSGRLGSISASAKRPSRGRARAHRIARASSSLARLSNQR